MAKRSGRSRGRRGRSKHPDEEGFELGTDKLYFKIGEVAEIVELAPHVLRYWESEFPLIKPQKSRSQQRVYTRRDVENLLRIKHLVHERKFTIAGAKQELRGGARKIPRAEVSGLYRARQSLGRVREQLDLLAAAVHSNPGPGDLAADPAAFVREAGGARALLASNDEGQPRQQLLERPRRSGPNE